MPADAAAAIAAIRRYHSATKHSPWSVRASRHSLDWSNQPIPYKVYLDRPRIPLPQPVETGHPALDALAGRPPATHRATREAEIDLGALAALLVRSNGIVRRRRTPGGEVAFRAAGCTGALYHVELYVATAGLAGLPAGLYHYAPYDDSLRPLRERDVRGAIVEASGGEPAVARAPLVVLATSTWWRNAWKYGSRAYRHAFWDTGTILANLLAVAAALGLPARIVAGFADPALAELLGLDPAREATIALVALGSDGPPPPPSGRLEPLRLPVAPVSRHEVVDPEIVAAHAATSLSSGAEAAAWRGAGADGEARAPRPSVPDTPIRPLPPPTRSDDSIEVVIRRRGSSRRFRRAPITPEALSTLLEVAAADVPADWTGRGGRLAETFLFVHAVDRLVTGLYRFDRLGRELELLRTDDARRLAGHAALDQPLGADAAVDIVFLADLERVFGLLGARGYRAAQLEAAIVAGRIWLAAYALRLGATGLTFYDDDLVRAFVPDAEGWAALFLLAVGRPFPVV